MKQEHRVEPGKDAQQVIQVLEERLYEHNSAKIERRDGSLFSRVVQGGSGDIIAGIAGWTWAGACEITQLWVSEKLRHGGIGRRLLEAAEEEARTRKCSIVLLRTYSFQAPSFYEKQGYRIVHVLEEFPPGYRYYTLTKSLP
jgi:GNAT superfamily N-acetyltransferase